MFPKNFISELEAVIRSPLCDTPPFAKELLLIFKKEGNALNGPGILKCLKREQRNEQLSECANETCLETETRTNYFKRCPLCRIIRYCSRACQVMHWQSGHKRNCVVLNEKL